MITEYLHKPSPDGIWLNLPLIKTFSTQYVVSGTWHVPDAIRLKNFWLQLTDNDIDKILSTMKFATKVWVLDRAGLQYSASLVELPDQLAESLKFNYQIRVNGDGEILGKNEVCIADDVLAEKYLETKGIVREKKNIPSPVPVLPIQKAWEVVHENPDNKKNINVYKNYWHQAKIDL